MGYKFDAADTKRRCVEWIREWFNQNGNGCNAVFGVSGGKDSTVVGALCKEALGADRVIGVLMPNGKQSDIEDSYSVIDALGIRHVNINIMNAVDGISCGIRDNNFLYKDDAIHIELSEQAKINLPPRIRMATLYAISQSCNGRVANTCNLSEDYIGYSTRYGDGAGDFAPLGGMTSDEVVAIGDLYKELPYHLVHKTPSDGLCGKTDEDNFGFSYAVLNQYIRTGICDDSAVKEKIDVLHKKNGFKMQPIPAFYWK